MILKQTKITAVAFAALLLVSAGCSKEMRKEPPLERLELVSRFFESVRNRDFETAARQGDKLYAMENNNFLKHLTTIHESNIFIERAQKALDYGDVEEAFRIIEIGHKKYPQNRRLRDAHILLSQLRNAKTLIDAMKNARGDTAMKAALTAAEFGLAKTADQAPALKLYFKRYAEDIEKAKARSAQEERRLDAEKAKLGTPREPKLLPPTPGGKKTPRPAVTKPSVPESLERPAPIKAPEPETAQ